jgi:hypothetical protein
MIRNATIPFIEEEDGKDENTHVFWNYECWVDSWEFYAEKDKNIRSSKDGS